MISLLLHPTLYLFTACFVVIAATADQYREICTWSATRATLRIPYLQLCQHLVHQLLVLHVVNHSFTKCFSNLPHVHCVKV